VGDICIALQRDRARLEGEGGVVGEALTGLREPDRGADPVEEVERSVETGGVERERDRRFFLPDQRFSSGERASVVGARMLCVFWTRKLWPIFCNRNLARCALITLLPHSLTAARNFLLSLSILRVCSLFSLARLSPLSDLAPRPRSPLPPSTALSPA